jgi:hypothetical protein
MFRKTIIAIAATATIAAAALPSTASAHRWRGHHGFYAGVIGLGLIGAGLASTCYQYQWVETRFGLRRVLVNTCAY